MGLNKFEKDLRDKLNQREITPNAQAWDRLDAMLAVAEQKKPKRTYNWLYIAATVLGFLFIGIMFFMQTEEMVDKGREEVVLENQNKPEGNKMTQDMLPTVSDSNIASAEEPKIKNGSFNQNQSASNQNQNKNHQSTNALEVVNNTPDNQKMIASSNNQPPAERLQTGESIITNNQKNQQSSLTKVDELLAAVAQSPNGNPKTSVKVNAKNLLSEVDRQVNLSFREKMLRKASEVAEAVSTRNEQ